MALPILIGNAVFLRYLCRCNGKVRRCHIAPSPACLLYILAAGGYSGECADWLPGGRSFRTEEILYGYCAEHTLFRTGRVRGKGSECPAGCASHPAARAVQVLGLAGGLLSLYQGRCL